MMFTKRPIDYFIRVQKNSCWKWIGAKTPCRGFVYGVIRDGSKTRKAHAVFYERLRGPIQKGLELDHRCRNTLCVNPDHLEPVTHKVNVLRGNSPAAMNARKTVASCGHPFTGKYRSSRYCKPCRNKWHREYYRRRKAAGR